MTLITYSQEELVKDVKGQAKGTHLHKQISTKEEKTAYNHRVFQ